MSTPQTGGLKPSRRTLVKGAAWSVPVVAVGSPAIAQNIVCSPNNTDPECNPVPPPVPQPGSACKHPGNRCGSSLRDAYHYVFCLSNDSGQNITVNFPSMTVNGQTKAPSPSSVVVPAGTANMCVTLHITDMGNSANGQGTLAYNYTWINEFNEVVPVSGSVSTGVNDLPPCSDCDGAAASSSELEDDVSADTTDQSRASGRSARDRVVVPNVVGLDVDEAGLTLTSAGLTLDRASQTGIVASQSPAAGTPVQPSTVVTVRVGRARTAAPTAETTQATPTEVAPPPTGEASTDDQ